MAGSNSTITIPKERQRLVLQACLEIEQMSRLLRSGSSIADEFAIRGVCMRTENLAEIISTAIFDDECKFEDLVKRLGAEGELDDE